MSFAIPTIAEAARQIAAKKLSPVELTKACLDRVHAHDDRLHAFVHLTEERALAEARAAETAIIASGPKGPLHGIPIGLKDIVDTKGIPTTCQSKLLQDNIPDADATCAEKLNAAGSVLIGKLTAEDCALMLQALAGHDPRDPASAKRPIPDYAASIGGGIKGTKIGVIHHFHETDHKVSDDTQRGITAAIDTLRGLGADIREVQLSPLQDWHACGSLISIVERAAAYEEWSRTRLGDFGERMRTRLMLGAFVSGVDYLQAVRRRRELRAELKAAMADLDVVVTAVFPGEAPPIDALPKWDIFQQPSFMMPFNVAGYPAMSLCSGFSTKGLPLAIQLVGKPFQEATVLRIADAFEKATPFRDRRPLAA